MGTVMMTGRQTDVDVLKCEMEIKNSCCAQQK